MTRAVRVVGAAIGLLLLASPIASARAQTAEEFTPPAECSLPPPAPAQEGITVTVVSPAGSEPRTTAVVPVEARFVNESRRPVVNQPNGQITLMEAYVLACEPDQVVPAGSDPVDPPGEPREATFTWSPQFPTNGRFAVVFEAKGTSSNPDGQQSARAVASVQLAVPPKKPTNVTASDPTNGIVAISWEYADPEPDLFGFEIRRAKQGSADYTTIKNGAVGPTVRSVSDAPPVGAWRYQVVSYRRGAPEGVVSRDDTVEVPEPAPSAEASTDGTSPSGSGTAAGSNPTTGGSTTTVAGVVPGSPNTPRASVDLAQFAAALNARRATPNVRLEPPDPGFQETLPFDVTADPEAEDEPEEIGADEPNVGLGQQVISDPGERRRSLGFVAFGFLLFVLSMTGLFVKSEVKRADLLDLDAVDHDADPRADDEHDAATMTAPIVASAALRRRRRRGPVDGLADDPASDVDSAADDAGAADAAPVLALAGPTVRRRGRRAEPPVEAPGDEVAIAPDLVVAAPAGPTPLPVRRRRRAATAAEAPTPHGNGTATMEIPETRRRWSPRAAAPMNGAPVPVPVHDFDDLADHPDEPSPVSAVSGDDGARRPSRPPEAPLDAPGLDIPDPTASPARPRARRATARR